MATLGYTGGGGWAGYNYSDGTTQNMVQQQNNTAVTGGTLVMPVTGYLTACSLYVGGDGASQSGQIYVYIGSGTYLIAKAVTFAAGSRAAGGQGWVTATRTAYLLPKGTAVAIGFWRPTSGGTTWSWAHATGRKYALGEMATAPSNGGLLINGTYSYVSDIEIGAYITYTPAAPVLSSASATSGHIGDTVTLSGYAFTGVSAVSVNGVSASFTVVDDSTLSVVIPAGAGAGVYSVTNANGTTTGLSWTTQPTWTSSTPTAGAEGASVVLAGTGFTGASVVSFNGTSASFVVNSDSQITATVPAGATYGAITVTANGQSCTTSAFTVQDTISGIAPTAGAVGASVVITGTGFSGATSVKFGGVSASFAINSHTQITATVPAGAVQGSVTVAVGGGYSVSFGTFTPATRRVRRAGVWVYASAANFRRGGVWVQPTALQHRRGAAWSEDN